MTAYLISMLNVLDKEKMMQYSVEAGELVSDFGGAIALRGNCSEVLAGGPPNQLSGQMSGIITFPDMPALKAWYESEAYQALIPLRNEACEMSMVTYDAMV